MRGNQQQLRMVLAWKTRVLPNQSMCWCTTKYDTIKKAIKKESSNIFATIDAPQMELFESLEDIQQEKPLNALEKWNSTVTWGTENAPLFVPISVKHVNDTPWSHSNGECGSLRVSLDLGTRSITVQLFQLHTHPKPFSSKTPTQSWITHTYHTLVTLRSSQSSDHETL